MTCLWISRSLLTVVTTLVLGCSSDEPIEPPVDTGGGATDLFIGDTTPALTIPAGQLRREHHLTVSDRTEVAIFLQGLEGGVWVGGEIDGIDQNLFANTWPDDVRELLQNRTDRLFIPAGKTLKVTVHREEYDIVPSPRYRLFVYRVNRAPEHDPGTVILEQVRSEEDLETSADIDEYSLVGQEGKDLVGYLANEPADAFTFWLGFYAKNEDDAHLAVVGSAPEGVPLEDNGSQLLTIPPGAVVVRVIGAANLPAQYRFVIRQGSRAPETAPATVGINAVISEALDYTGDLDEFTIHGTPGVLVNIILEDNNAAPLFPYLTSFGDGVPHRTAFPDSNPVNAMTGAIPVPPSGDIGFRVSNYTRQNPEYATTGRGAYRVRVVQINPGPETAPAALTGSDSIIGEQIDEFDDRDEFTLAWPVGAFANIVLRRNPGPLEPLRLDLTSMAGDSVQSVFLTYADSLEQSGPFSLPAGSYRVRVIARDLFGAEGAFTGPYAAYIYLLSPARAP